jgi:hypothetical protein
MGVAAFCHIAPTVVRARRAPAATAYIRHTHHAAARSGSRYASGRDDIGFDSGVEMSRPSQHGADALRATFVEPACSRQIAGLRNVPNTMSHSGRSA